MDDIAADLGIGRQTIGNRHKTAEGLRKCGRETDADKIMCPMQREPKIYQRYKRENGEYVLDDEGNKIPISEPEDRGRPFTTERIYVAWRKQFHPIPEPSWMPKKESTLEERVD